MIGKVISSPSAVLNLWDLGNQYITSTVADVWLWRTSEHSGAAQYIHKILWIWCMFLMIMNAKRIFSHNLPDLSSWLLLNHRNKHLRHTILALISVGGCITSLFQHLDEKGCFPSFLKTHLVYCWSQEKSPIPAGGSSNNERVLTLIFFFYYFWEEFLKPDCTNDPGSHFLSKLILSHSRCICSTAQTAFWCRHVFFIVYVVFFFLSLNLHVLFCLHTPTSSQPSDDWDKWNKSLSHSAGIKTSVSLVINFAALH